MPPEQTTAEPVSLEMLRSRQFRNYVSPGKWAFVPDALCQAAADEIERLREKIAELEQLHD